MVSRIRRRSGNAVTEYCQLIGFQPSLILMAGVGSQSGELDCFSETWPDAPIMGYEPHPETHKHLDHSRFSRLRCCALSDKTETRDLYFRPRHKDGSTLSKRNDQPDIQTTQVRCVQLDDDLEQSQIPQHNNLFWLDCEGHEDAVLRGAHSFLQTVAVVNVEITCYPRSKDWAQPSDVNALLTDAGFSWVWTHTHRSCRGQFDQIWVRPRLVKRQFCMNPELW